MADARLEILDEVVREMVRTDENAETDPAFEDYAADIVRRLEGQLTVAAVSNRPDVDDGQPWLATDDPNYDEAARQEQERA
jgi:hypothetical protein